MIQQTTSQHAERQYLHTLVAGAWLPLLQATIISVVVAVGIWIIAVFVFDAIDPHKPAILFFAGTWIFMIVKLLSHWLSLTTVEHIVQRDLNNDGVIGEKPQQQTAKPRRVVIQVDTVKENGQYQVGDKSNLYNLPGTPDQLYTLACGLVEGMPFSEKTWSGPDKLYSIPEFRLLKTELFKRSDPDDPTSALIQYISEKDKRQGIQLTEKGKKMMEQIASSPLPHTDE